MGTAKTILRAPSELKPHILAAIYRRGGSVNIGYSANKPGPDRDIYRIVATAIGVTEEEQRLRIIDRYPEFYDDVARGRRASTNDAERNLWDYTMLVAVQQLKEFQGFIRKGMPRGIWELTDAGRVHAAHLASSGIGQTA